MTEVRWLARFSFAIGKRRKSRKPAPSASPFSCIGPLERAATATRVLLPQVLWKDAGQRGRVCSRIEGVSLRRSECRVKIHGIWPPEAELRRPSNGAEYD
jgi:hypothetical protein